MSYIDGGKGIYRITTAKVMKIMVFFNFRQPVLEKNLWVSSWRPFWGTPVFPRYLSPFRTRSTHSIKRFRSFWLLGSEDELACGSFCFGFAKFPQRRGSIRKWCFLFFVCSLVNIITHQNQSGISKPSPH